MDQKLKKLEQTLDIKLDKKQQFLSSIEQSAHDGNTLQSSVRNSGLAHLEQLAFPTSKSEAWKYTRVNKILSQSLRIADAPQTATAINIPTLAAAPQISVNGHTMSVNNVDGLTIMPIREAVASNHPLIEKYWGSLADSENAVFTALNSAYSQDGFLIHITGKVDDVIHLQHIVNEDQLLVQQRNLIVAEAHSEAHIVHQFATNEGLSGLVNEVSEIVVGDGAHLKVEKIQEESDNGFHISNEYVKQADNSDFHINTYTVKGGWVRNNLTIALDGKNINTDLYGLYHPNTGQHVDNHTLVLHNEPHCESNELYKGLIYDSGKAVFNGKVIVAQDAQKTNAYQQNANIVLSDKGNVNSKPELEIYADDVKCSHGSTIGQLEEDALFYLMARGISRMNAKKILTEAFLSEVIEHCEIEAVRDYVVNHITKD